MRTVMDIRSKDASTVFSTRCVSGVNHRSYRGLMCLTYQHISTRCALGVNAMMCEIVRTLIFFVIVSLVQFIFRILFVFSLY